jgi:predicted esterase
MSMTEYGLGFAHRYVPAERPGLPTLLLLHGTGGDENDLVPLGQLLMPGAGILSPRGKVLENGMPRYFRRLAAGVFDLEDLSFRTNELADFVTSSARTNGFEPSRVVAVGYSNGANIGASLLLLRPGSVASAVLFHSQVPLEPAQPPDLTGTPIFLSGGRGDTMVPPAETERLGALLSASGADVTLHWEAGGHALGRSEVEAARRWLTEKTAAGAV